MTEYKHSTGNQKETVDIAKNYCGNSLIGRIVGVNKMGNNGAESLFLAAVKDGIKDYTVGVVNGGMKVKVTAFSEGRARTMFEVAVTVSGAGCLGTTAGG